MADHLKPRDGADVEDAVRTALGQGRTLDVCGAGTKRGIGRPSQTDATLDLARLSGITLYEPEELVLSARAGTPLAEIESAIAARGQQLAFEPLDYGPVLGQPAGAATIGGTIAANLAGPRRIRSGAARDHFLGVTAVSGRGETFKSGGRVVKNVTGYDLCKLLAGSWGTLAVMTDVTLKVLPRAETENTLLVLGLGDVAAADAMTAAMGSACDVSAAAHVPAGVARRLPAHSVAVAGRAVTALRLEGVAPSVAHRRQLLQHLLRPFGPLGVLDGAESQALWGALRDALPFARDTSRALWRISTAPSQGTRFGSLVAAGADAELFYDWAGGLVWAAVPPGDDAGAMVIRSAVAATGGHATLIRAPVAVRAAVDVFPPQDPVHGALTKRIKESFDPAGILNRGRMYAGI